MTTKSRSSPARLAPSAARSPRPSPTKARTSPSPTSTSPGLQETARAVEAAGRDALPLRCDVTQRADVEALVDQTLARFGRFTTMVANAGVAQTAPFLDMTDDDWHRVINVNLTGVFLCDQVAAQRLVAQGEGGQIVNLASQLAEIGWPSAPPTLPARPA